MKQCLSFEVLTETKDDQMEYSSSELTILANLFVYFGNVLHAAHRDNEALKAYGKAKIYRQDHVFGLLNFVALSKKLEHFNQAMKDYSVIIGALSDCFTLDNLNHKNLEKDEVNQTIPIGILSAPSALPSIILNKQSSMAACLIYQILIVAKNGKWTEPV